MVTEPRHNSVTRVEKRRDKKEHSAIALGGFAEFWAVYPRHDGKAAAENAWRKLAPDIERQAEIMAAIGDHKRSPRWLESPRFIPHAATWLNGRRWEDEPAAAEPYRRGDSAQVPDKSGFVF